MTMMPQTATIPSLRQEAAHANSVRSVEVASDPARIATAWAELEQAAPASLYQSRGWVLPWLDSFGAAAAIKPTFVLAREPAGAASALLCLGLTQHGPMRIARFLGGKEANFNLGLFRPGPAWTDRALLCMLRTAARATNADLFLFQNQPLAWEGMANPLTLLAHQPAASNAYASALGRDADAFLQAKLSKNGRKKLRKKAQRLAAMGPLTHVVARDATTADAILDTLLRQKRERFGSATLQAHFEDPTLRRFLAALCQGGAGPLELHALVLGDRIIATYAGAPHRGRFSCMYNSFDPDPEIAKSSPGDILLTKLIATKCAEGIATFDLGIGEARYKNSFCDETVPLVDTLVPVTALGRLAAPVIAARLRLKRRVKQNPRLMALVRRRGPRG